MTNDWQTSLENARAGLAQLEQARAELAALSDAATADILRYLRVDASIDLDPEAIRASLTRPYTLLPINDHEAWLIHWRGVKMPVLGWVVAQEPAFIKARVTRSMDLLTPLPAWMKQELGWKPPAHKAVMDGQRTAIRVLEGDESTFKRKYGANLGSKLPDGSYKVRGGGAWIKLVAALIRDGILPYEAQPVAPEHWEADAKSAIVLRDYQVMVAQEFLDKGSIFLNFPPGAGKTFIGLHILNHFTGRTLLVVDSSLAVEQWKDRLHTYGNPRAIANTIVSTMQGAKKYTEQEFDLLVADEAQRLPADTFSRLAFVKTKYRIGMSGTAWREDDRQFMIAALTGFPVHIPWADLIRAGMLKRPRIVVATVPDERAKASYVRGLLGKRKGKTLVFCDWLKQGQELADALDIPFIHGQSQNKLDRIREADVCVVSRVADRSLDLPDLRLVIEVAGAGSSREQFGQRVGRLLHGEFEGEFHVVFIPEEAARFRSRLFGVEAELGGEIEIEFVTVGHMSDAQPIERRARRARKPSKRPANVQAGAPQGEADEISAVMSLPSVDAKLSEIEKAVGERTAPYVRRVFRLCFRASFSPKEIAEGRGIRDAATVSRFRSACKALRSAGLFAVSGKDETGEDRYTANQDKINRLRALAEAVR